MSKSSKRKELSDATKRSLAYDDLILARKYCISLFEFSPSIKNQEIIVFLAAKYDMPTPTTQETIQSFIIDFWKFDVNTKSNDH